MGEWALLHLREWGWDRKRCLRKILAAGLMVPAKSACLCCPSTKPSELHELEARQLRTIVVKHIFEEALVVGDLSERNPNVFYELALLPYYKKSFSFR
jgi:hypothetical protein